jgi:hypothetical protein
MTPAVAAIVPAGKIERLPRGSAWQSRRKPLSNSGAFAQLVNEYRELHVVGARSYTNHDIERGKVSEYTRSNDLAKLTLQSIPLDGRMPELGHDEPHPRMRQRGSKNSDLEMLGPKALPLYRGTLKFGAPRYPLAAGESKAVRRLRTWSEA